MKLLFALILALASPVFCAPLVLHNETVIDSVNGDTLYPQLAHSIFIDTVTAADTVGYSINAYLKASRWPDGRTTKMYGIGEGMIWTELAEPNADSVEGLEGYRRVWWFGSLMLEDSVITPGRYEVSGDSLLPSN